MGLEPGMSTELTVVVDESMTAASLGNEGVPVFGTPTLVRYFEGVATQLIAPDLAPGQASVGAHVDVRHLAPTPVGMRIVFRATLTEVDGRRVVFQLTADDEKERVGEGTHERYVIDKDRFLARVEAKQPKRPD